MMYCYIVKESSEIPLKSHRTRPRFEKKLLNNIKYALRREGITDYDIVIKEGVITIKSGNEKIGDVVSNVFGVHRVCKALCGEFHTINDIVARAEEIFKDVVTEKKFAVRVKRAGSHVFTSLDVAAKVGEALLKYSAGVNLSNPDVVVSIEIRDNVAYYILKCWDGVKGLPIGTEGRVLSLFSGGYDSTLASWLAGKRGCEVDFLHFFMGSKEMTMQAFLIAKELTKWLSPYESKMTIIDITPLLSEIRIKVRNDYSQVVLRWYMHYIAQKLSSIHNYDAVITGESVGQASSQTLKNLSVIEESLELSNKKPVIRPLAFMDKEEIIEKIRSLGLYEMTSKVKEVCRLAIGPVTTRAHMKILINEVKKVSKELIDVLLRTRITVSIKDTELNTLSKLLDEFILGVEVSAKEAIKMIKEGAIPIDVRDLRDYEAWHLSNAIHITELNKMLKEGLDFNKSYVIYCDYGTLSLAYAKMLRRIGINAFSVKGGINELKKLLRAFTKS